MGKGDFKLNRVDCTVMFDVGNTANALSWIRQAEMNATLSHRGRGQVTKGSTLYFGKSSRRSSVKFYAKGEEFQKHSHAAFLQLPALSLTTLIVVCVVRLFYVRLSLIIAVFLPVRHGMTCFLCK
ncbi:hypothetical protein KD913_28600 [Klebsiella pneumoniae]